MVVPRPRWRFRCDFLSKWHVWPHQRPATPSRFQFPFWNTGSNICVCFQPRNCRYFVFCRAQMVFTGFNVVGTYWSALCATQRGWAAGTSWQWKAGTWKKFAAARNKMFSHIFVEFQRSYVSHNFIVNQYFKVFNWSCERHDAEALPASHSQRRMCRTPHQSHLEPRQQSTTVDFLSLWFHRSTTLCWTCSELVIQFIFCWWMHWQERQERFSKALDSQTLSRVSCIPRSPVMPDSDGTDDKKMLISGKWASWCTENL